MNLTVAGFDWDDGNREKCVAHGVSIAEIEGVFRGEPALAQIPRTRMPRRDSSLSAVGGVSSCSLRCARGMTRF